MSATYSNHTLSAQLSAHRELDEALCGLVDYLAMMLDDDHGPIRRCRLSCRLLAIVIPSSGRAPQCGARAHRSPRDLARSSAAVLDWLWRRRELIASHVRV